jgi:hypothetical protein
MILMAGRVEWPAERAHSAEVQRKFEFFTVRTKRLGSCQEVEARQAQSVVPLRRLAIIQVDRHRYWILTCTNSVLDGW